MLPLLLAQDPAPDREVLPPAELHFVLEEPGGALQVALLPGGDAPPALLCAAPCSALLPPGPTALYLYEPDRWQMTWTTELRPGRSTLVTVRPRRGVLENLGGCTWSIGTAALLSGSSLAWRSWRRGDERYALAGAAIAANGLGLAILGIGVWTLGNPRAVESPYPSSGSTGLNE